MDGIDQFLKEHPLMSQCPTKANEPNKLKGLMSFNLVYKNHPTVNEKYEIEITIPPKHSNQLPSFTELGNKIPRSGDYHINPDGTLCLGSPIRLIMELKNNRDLTTFCTNFLAPFIYAVTLKRHHNIHWIFGELEHGNKGEISDYQSMFEVKCKDEVLGCLKALSCRKRVANKLKCPCMCGQKLSFCDKRFKLNTFRNKVSRKIFRKSVNRLSSTN